MNGKILAGMVTALVFSGSAMAGGIKHQKSSSAEGTGGSGMERASQQEINDLQQADVAPPPVDQSLQGVGGSGDVKEPLLNQNQEGIGGSGQVVAPSEGMKTQSGMSSECAPAQTNTGGSGLLPSSSVQQSEPANKIVIESSLQRDFDADKSNEQAIGGSGYTQVPVAVPVKAEPKDEGQRKGDMRGLTLLVGAGVEGYTGGLAPAVNPGAALGVTAALKPSKVLGIELGYSGAVNNLSTAVGGSGPDIIRNGGQAALTLGLTAAPIQPYILGGFGISPYNVRHGEELGFRSDTSSNIPVGAGLRTHIGDFTADARLNYNIMLANDFASGVANDLWTGRYTGTVNLGGTF